MDKAHCRTVLLAGVGGDSHSVGLIILRRALEQHGYLVDFLSTQNTPEEVCKRAGGVDAVLISNMDGHASYYLEDLPALRAEYGVAGIPWYLGGNPSLTGDAAAAEELRTLGFRRVFHSYVDPATVLAMLDADLEVDAAALELGRVAGAAGRARAVPEPPPALERAPFRRQRDEVLMQWHTGASAGDLQANASAFTGRLALADLQAAAEREGRTLIHPRTGVADAEEQLELFRVLGGAGADVLSFQIDSLTRNNAHDRVEALFKERDTDPAAFHGLNGFPLVNHGVDIGRRITSEFPAIPFQVRHSTRDPRLLAEITYACGIAAYEGGALTYNLPYYRDYSPRHSVVRWQYVDRLTGLYHERFGVTVDREFFGVLTAALVPACLAVAVDVLEALLAAEQGVKSVSLGYAEQGHRSQDIAAIRALRRVGRRYLDDFGHEDVAVHTVFHQYMAAFPDDADKARQLVRGSAATAGLSEATRLMLKTAVESTQIPSAADNADAVRLVRATLNEYRGRPLPAAVAEEEELIVAEASAILDAVLRLDFPDLGDKVARAIELGLVDIPFSPNLWNADRSISVRDLTGAVRFGAVGSVPLPEPIRRFHADAVAKRLEHDRLDLFAAVEQDVLRTARGDFDRWPLAD